MRYLIVVPDGAADRETESLGGMTPLEAADMAYTDSLAAEGESGLVKTIPDGIAPGSDAANLSVMGYDPAVYLTGRSPLEAVSIGIDMSDTDVAFRTNLVTLEGMGEYENLTIKDHSAGDITTEEADELIRAVNSEFESEKVKFYTGFSYRHCLIVKDGGVEFDLTPPHDALGERAGAHLPRGGGSGFIADMMKRSYELLKSHPVNAAREEKGLNPANSLWIWGQGRKPALPPYYEKYKVTGSVISAVDLIKGIGICAGLAPIAVPGATGTVSTNYEGKANAAIGEFRRGKHFVFMHMEGPDECSHQGDLAGKMESLKRIDQKVVKPVVDYLKGEDGDFKVLIVPDHRTPICIRTHSSEPVPFVIYDSTKKPMRDETRAFTEKSGEKGKFFESGTALADYFFLGKG
ncbi:MAG: cofactor-independent phosphoglycerate mutase [Clostridiales bacterium]|nr:cofactor-independent phosphoglycerate mutase [Clostridiales bacterium]